MKAHLAARTVAVRPAKVLLVRRRERRGSEGIHVFWGSSAEAAPALSSAVLDSYEQLVELDFARPGESLRHPLLLVCTHGKRDACCARYGRALYEAVREQVEDAWVWQCSHVGGDRFAGNLVCLPEGLYFGRVGPDDVWDVLDEYLAGRIHLGFYRGRSCYSFPQQAAERAVREATGLVGIEELELVSSSPIRFRAGVREYEVGVREERGDLSRLTCSSETTTRPRRFVARSLRESAGRRGRADPPHPAGPEAPPR